MTIGGPVGGVGRGGGNFLQFVERRPSPQSLLVGEWLGATAGGRFWGEHIEPVQLGFGVARAVVWWGIEQAVARHDAVQAATSDPVVDVPGLFLWINKLDAGP